MAESRGKQSTATRPPPGEMCATITVSDRCPAAGPPILPLRPDRLSEPITSMFRALFSLGGRVPCPEIVSVLIPSRTLRYFAYPYSVPPTRSTASPIAAQPVSIMPSEYRREPGWRRMPSRVIVVLREGAREAAGAAGRRFSGPWYAVHSGNNATKHHVGVPPGGRSGPDLGNRAAWQLRPDPGFWPLHGLRIVT